MSYEDGALGKAESGGAKPSRSLDDVATALHEGRELAVPQLSFAKASSFFFFFFFLSQAEPCRANMRSPRL